MQLLRFILIVSILLSISCSTGFVVVPSSSTTAYLPYVEDAVLPPTVQEGEDFEIQLKLSAVLKPGIIGMVPTESVWKPGFRNGEFQWFPYDYATPPTIGVMLTLWATEPLNESAGAEWTILHMAGLPAGTYAFYITSAATYETGGMAVRYRLTPSPGAVGATASIPAPGAVYKVYTLSVLPAE